MATAKKRKRKKERERKGKRGKKRKKKKKESGGKKMVPLALARQKKSMQVTSCQLARKDGTCRGGREKNGAPWL